FAGPGPSVATEAWIVSLAANVVVGGVMRLSAPIALPRSTLLTVVAAGTGEASGAVGSGAGASAAGGASAGSCCFLQAASARLPATSAASTRERRLRFMATPWKGFDGGSAPGRGRVPRAV